MNSLNLFSRVNSAGKSSRYVHFVSTPLMFLMNLKPMRMSSIEVSRKFSAQCPIPEGRSNIYSFVRNTKLCPSIVVSWDVTSRHPHLSLVRIRYGKINYLDIDTSNTHGISFLVKHHGTRSC